jgi:serine/threonine protein kinase
LGEVYQACDARLDRTVAIKICKGRFNERFEREARAISSLNHQHLRALVFQSLKSLTQWSDG